MMVPLKVTTDYSLLKSLIKVKDLVNFCVQNNLKSCAICDNNLFGAVEFYKTCLENNIKPLIGLEININNEIVYLYAKNYFGYKNLLKINSIINERNISIVELQNYSSNLLLIIPFKSLKIRNDLAFFENVYLSYENDVELKNELLITKDVVYLNDIRCFKKEDEKYLKYLDVLKEENSKNYFNNAFNFNLTKFDIEKQEEVNNLLNVEMPKGKRYIPIYKEGVDSFLYLKNLCYKGLYKRLKGNVPQKYVDRLNYELSVIKKMDFVDYFLIVYDYVLYAKKNNILANGRGSAAGSLTSYVIGITDIDPLKYNLLFERFLNPDRVTMPDIDMDFDNTKREEVINYVRERYGKENVSGGITFTTLKTRLVLREVGSIFKIDDKLLNKFLKVIDKDKNLKANLEQKVIKEYLNTYPKLKEVYRVSLVLEGLKRNISTHAAGIVIANVPLDEIIPMYKNKDIYLTGVTMEYLEDLGLLKMDFLALKNLSTISNIIKNIPNFKIENIPLDDKLVYELFSKANTDGIFQFETKAFKNMLPKYKPQNFNELVACVALVRPGPSRELETYIKRKNGLEKITYYDDSLKEILEETYGVIVYQEQVMSILVKMANFTYAEADNVRRAMAKKKINIIMEMQDKFLNNAIRNGYNKDLALNIFNHIKSFAAYGFNKAHSVSYALVSYQMAYLKVHYQALFTFELLNNETNIHKIKNYLNELKMAKLVIKGVSINSSKESYILKDKTVFLPFSKIQNIRKDLIKEIMEERENGPFLDVFDFFKRTFNFCTKKDYTLLIEAGTLEEFSLDINTLKANLDVLINYGSLYNDLKEYALIPELIKKETSAEEKRNYEINSYGFYISNHPASKYNDKRIMKLENIKENVFKSVVCYVLVEDISKIKTKTDKQMAFISGSDETGVADFTIFPLQFSLLQNVEKNDMIKVWGKVSKRYDKYSIIVSGLNKE